MFNKGKTSSILLAALLTVTPFAYAKTYYGLTTLSDKKAEDITIMGTADLNQVEAKTLSVTGPLKFHKIEISDKTTVIGPLSGKEGKFGRLNVTGTMDVSKIQVNGDTKIIGTLEATDATFKNIEITTHKLELTNTLVNDIHIKKNPTSDKEQTLTIHGKSTVMGDITFDSGKGQIKVDKSVDLKGAIKGGNVVLM